MALASDATVRDGVMVGDPTEGALVVLAEKGGLDTEDTRQLYPRVAELPFDAAYKLMATFHRMTDELGRDVVRCFVKGAPDQLLARAALHAGPRRPAPGPRRRRLPGPVHGGERAPRRAGPARAGDRPQGLRPRRVRPGRRPARPARGPDRPHARRHRGPAPPAGEGRDREGEGRRHPGPHDHRRPQGHRSGDRRPARHRGAGDQRSRVRRHVGRRADRRPSTGSA